MHIHIGFHHSVLSLGTRAPLRSGGTKGELREPVYGGGRYLAACQCGRDLRASTAEYLVDHLDALQRRGTSAAVRVIAGTAVSVLERIAAGAFSERLFYRLNTIHLMAAHPAIDVACVTAGELIS